MALIKEVRGHTPVIGENTFLAETAVILGDVTIGRDCSIWYNAVLRGDVNKIVIGDRTNIQDGVVLHTIYDKAKHPSQTIIGNDVSVEVKKEMIRKALEKHHGNRKSAAQDLNISERTLYRKIKEYGLD